MRRLVGIFKKLVVPVALRIIFFLVKDHPWWIVGASVVSGVWAFLTGFLPWYMWVVVLIGLFSFFMAIRQTWFPKKKPRLVIPEYVRDDRGYEGLHLTNEGSCAVLNVFIEPLQIGNQTVEFGGPEVTYLKAKETCFFSLDNVPPAVVLKNWKGSSTLMRVLREWQKDLGDDWGATIEGRITYEDIHKLEHETRFRVGVDVLAELGVSVLVI